MTPLACRGLVALACAAGATAQSYRELTTVRTPANPYASVFEVEAGGVGTKTTEENPATGLRDDISWDGHVYYSNAAFGSRRGKLEAYAGRDGLYASYLDKKLVGSDTDTRIELRGRPWVFYRDGAYDGSKFGARGLFDGADYEAYLGFGKDSGQGLYVDLGPFYKRLSFDRSRLTRSAPPELAYTIPEDFAAYGGRLYIEQNAVQLDRRTGMPRDGFVLTLVGEREWNTSKSAFGLATTKSELPDAVYRANGRLDWYVPATDALTWEIFAQGGLADRRDRLVAMDSSHALGNQWGDVQLRLRCQVGNSWTITPYVQGQYSRLPGDTRLSSQKKFFLGAGVESYLHFNEVFSLHGYYSYLNNESRESIRVDEDVHGQHMFYLGMVIRFAGGRK
jgi:hypothetical protein